MISKTCTKCAQCKPLENFYSNGHGRKSSICKDCAKLKVKAYRMTPAGKATARRVKQKRAMTPGGREAFRACARKRAAKNREYFRERAHRRWARTVTECVTYFIEAAGLVKIGKTTNLARRLETLRSGSAVHLSLMGAIPTRLAPEKELHDYYWRFHSHGEWYALPAEEKARLISALLATKESGLTTPRTLKCA